MFKCPGLTISQRESRLSGGNGCIPSYILRTISWQAILYPGRIIHSSTDTIESIARQPSLRYLGGSVKTYTAPAWTPGGCPAKRRLCPTSEAMY